MPGFMTVHTTCQVTDPGGHAIDHPPQEDLYPMEWERFSSLTFSPVLEIHTPTGIYRVELTIRAELEPAARLEHEE